LIQSFIGDHLGDPGLSPGMIAAAHHISVRTLHKLYQVQDQTISASIHWRRLERCRQDLPGPALRDRPVSAVGARWGIPRPRHFQPRLPRRLRPTARRTPRSPAEHQHHRTRPDHRITPTPWDERGHDPLARFARSLFG